jgi:hypothetical protein
MERLSGNELLKVIDNEGQLLRFFVKKKCNCSGIKPDAH